MDLRDSLRLAARRFPDKTCVVLQGRRVTYRDLDARVARLAAALRRRGVAKGTRVGFLQVNSTAFIECLYACLQLGAILVPLNYRLKAQELEYIVNQVGLSALVLGERYAALAEVLRDGAPELATYICLEGPAPGMEAYEGLFEGRDEDPPDEPLDERDIALILLTSGTTGLPKGAMLSRRSLHHLALGMALSLKLDHHDRVLAGGPLYHVGALGYLLPSLYVGATWVMVPQFEAREVLETIQRERLTVCWFAPAMLNFMTQVEGGEAFDVTSLRLIQYGGGPTPPRVLRDAARRFGCRFMQVYGLTEAAPQTFLDPEDHVFDPHDPRSARLASIGKPAPNVELRIVDAEGREVAPGQIGEILCRCDTLMDGYWQKPEETARAVGSGWLRTGDLARRDADGFVYLVDRLKDMIIRGGENIYPAEIERVLYEHPAIAEAAVVGLPDAAWGEAVKAVVVLRPGRQLAAQEVIDHCCASLASYKKPTVVEFVAALPRTSGGKVLKTDLRARAAADGSEPPIPRSPP